MPDQLRLPALAIALLRVSLGVMFLAHSVVLKLMTFGLPGTAAFFRSVGLPDWLAYLTFVSELVGGIMPFLIGALVTVHAGNGWVFTSTGGGWEYPAYLIVLCVAQVLLGDGAFALAHSRPLGAYFGRHLAAA